MLGGKNLGGKAWGRRRGGIGITRHTVGHRKFQVPNRIRFVFSLTDEPGSPEHELFLILNDGAKLNPLAAYEWLTEDVGGSDNFLDFVGTAFTTGTFSLQIFYNGSESLNQTANALNQDITSGDDVITQLSWDVFTGDPDSTIIVSLIEVKSWRDVLAP